MFKGNKRFSVNTKKLKSFFYCTIIFQYWCKPTFKSLLQQILRAIFCKCCTKSSFNIINLFTRISYFGWFSISLLTIDGLQVTRRLGWKVRDIQYPCEYFTLFTKFSLLTQLNKGLSFGYSLAINYFLFLQLFLS